MKYKKHYWYILNLDNINAPVVYHRGFINLDSAKKARYKYLPKGKFQFIMGHKLRSYPTIVMIPLPKLGIKVLDDMDKVKGENRKYARSFLKKCRDLLKIKGTQKRGQFLDNITKVLNK